MSFARCYLFTGRTLRPKTRGSQRTFSASSYHSPPRYRCGLTIEHYSSISCPSQKAALDVHDAEEKTNAAAPKTKAKERPPADSEPVRWSVVRLLFSLLTGISQTVKQEGAPAGSHARLGPPSSQGRSGGRSIGRGDFDQAILTVRTGRLRPRVPKPPASKIFVDGARTSRVFD